MINGGQVVEQVWAGEAITFEVRTRGCDVAHNDAEHGDTLGLGRVLLRVFEPLAVERSRFM